MPATGRKKSGGQKFEFSKKQMDDIKEAFNLFNKDGSGSIETKELKVQYFDLNIIFLYKTLISVI